MNQISTADSYNAIVANIMTAQTQLNTDSSQLSSGEVSTDLQGYGSQAETLTAMQTLQGQVSGYIAQDQVLSNTLSTQNTALNQIAGAATGASQAITTALSAGVGDGLMQSLEDQFQNAAQGLNATNNGEYLFSGGQVNTPAVSVNSMTALAAAPSVASVFQNDQHIASSQISQNTTVQTGFLASNLGTNLLSAFQAIQTYVNTNGPFTGQLTTAQTTFLQGQITNLNNASAALNNSAAQNGGVQSQLADTQTDLTNQQTTLGGMIGNIANTNIAQVSANLQQAQLALQASAQVFLALNNSSLLNVLAAAGQ
jgi:flagellar hook-associated protein 3 FlgL